MNASMMIKSVMTGTIALTLAACGSSSAAAASSAAAGTEAAASTSAAAGEGKYDYLLDISGLEFPEVDTSNADGVLKKVLDEGVLTIATSPDYPPNEWIEDDGTVYGSEMMLAKYIADALGVDLRIETMDFSGTLTAVDTGKVDMAVSGYGWKKDREEAYELTIGYEGDPEKDYGHTLITTAANEGKFTSLEDFVGTHIMAQATSLQEMYVQDEILSLDTDGTTTYEPVATLDQAILGLASGKCDAVALDEHTAENYVEQSNGSFVLTNVMFDLTPYGDKQGNVSAIKKGETSMKDAVNTIIQFVNDKGYYQEWYTQAKAASGETE